MEHSRKHLKEASFLVLLFAAFSLIRMTVEVLVTGFGTGDNALGVSRELVIATMIALFVIGFILLIPQIYVGVRGIKIAKAPEAKKGHIVWAVILLVFSVFGIFSPISNIMANVSVLDNMIALCDQLLDVIVYCMYIKYSTQVLKSI
jgi:hypothetical protein